MIKHVERPALAAAALVAASATAAGAAHDVADPAPRGSAPAPGMERMHELHMQHPGMERMHQMHLGSHHG